MTPLATGEKQTELRACSRWASSMSRLVPLGGHRRSPRDRRHSLCTSSTETESPRPINRCRYSSAACRKAPITTAVPTSFARALCNKRLATSYAFERGKMGTPSVKTSAYSVTDNAHFPSLERMDGPPAPGGVTPSFKQMQMACRSPGIRHMGMLQFLMGA